MRRRSGHSDCISLQADLVVNGRRDKLQMSWTEVPRTTESSVSVMKVHIWQRGSVHSAALRLEKSEGILADPARC